MEWDSNARFEWGWEIEMPKNLTISSDENGGYSFSGFLDSSGKDGGGFSDMMEEETAAASVLSGEAMVGLKLGRQTCRREKSRTHAFPSAPYSPGKRSRASYESSLLPRCQVEGCNLDLTSAKDYHRRHKICADHSKSPTVVVAGMERRFCQQCSRLHELSEFDDQKRSCRRRLSAHNARRRRPQPEDIKLSSTHQKPYMGFLGSQASVSARNSTPQSSSSFKGGYANMMSNALEAKSMAMNAMETHRSFSIEAASSWSFRGHKEPSSFDQFIHGHNLGSTQPEMPLEMQSTRNTQIPHDFDCFCCD